MAGDAADGDAETGTPDTMPQETDNGPRPCDGVIDDEGSIALPPPRGGRPGVTGVTPGEVVATAAKSLGTIEDPVGSNRQPFGAAYGMNGVAWCNIFVSEVGRDVAGDYGLLG